MVRYGKVQEMVGDFKNGQKVIYQVLGIMVNLKMGNLVVQEC